MNRPTAPPDKPHGPGSVAKFIALILVIVLAMGSLIYRYITPKKSTNTPTISATIATHPAKKPDFLASDSLIDLRAKHLKTPKRAAKFYDSYERELKALIKYNEEKVIAPLRLKLQHQKRFTSNYPQYESD